MKSRTRTRLNKRRRRGHHREPDDLEFVAACRALGVPPGIWPRALTIMMANTMRMSDRYRSDL